MIVGAFGLGLAWAWLASAWLCYVMLVGLFLVFFGGSVWVRCVEFSCCWPVSFALLLFGLGWFFLWLVLVAVWVGLFELFFVGLRYLFVRLAFVL